MRRPRRSPMIFSAQERRHCGGVSSRWSPTPRAWAAGGRRGRAWRRGCTRSQILAAAPQLHRGAPREIAPHPREFGAAVPHVFTTSYLTHAAIEHHLATRGDADATNPSCSRPAARSGCGSSPPCGTSSSPGRKRPQQKLTSRRKNARERPGGVDQLGAHHWGGERLHGQRHCPMPAPVGHWFEVPNLLKNGTLARLLAQQPQLRTTFIHNMIHGRPRRSHAGGLVPGLGRDHRLGGDSAAD